MNYLHYKDHYFDGVNFDYLLALRNNDNIIEKLHFPIKKNEELIEKLIRMVDDDSYEVDDMYYAFKREYQDYGDYEYCLEHLSLQAFFIDPISYPYFDEAQYRKQAQIYKEDIEAAKTEASRNSRQNAFNKWSNRKKRDFINKCLPYIFANNYHKALVQNDVEKNCFIFSDETHGRFTYTRKITEDIEITLKTNFCYGSSSYMLVNVTYKGIPILPYSTWVRYYYARFSEILKCTRSYDPQRTNWNNCFDFVVWFVEKAIDNPDTFVRETIIQEVEGLIKGIEELLTLSDEKMKKEIMPKRPDKVFYDNHYIGIRSARMANESDLRYYTIAPEEVKLVYRMEKITGALHFLKSLKQLTEIYHEIEVSINKIKEINATFYPEIVNAIPPVKEYISSLNKSLKPIEKSLSIKQQQFDYLENKLQRQLKKVDLIEQDEFIELFKKKNPKYDKLSAELIALERQADSLKYQISNRETYLKQLEEAQLLIRMKVPAVNL